MCEDSAVLDGNVEPNPLLSVGFPGPRPKFTEGAVDLHIHSAPDPIARIGTSIDIAKAASEAGMRAIVLKDHLFPSCTKAVLTDQAVDGVRVFGGITMNNTAGGISPRSVEAAIASGARVVMFPTFDTLFYLEKKEKGAIQIAHSFGYDIEPVFAVKDGEVLPETETVLGIVAEHPELILSSGHLGPDEAVVVMERAAELGIRNKMIEHPNSSPAWTKEHYRRLVQAGTSFNMSYNPYHQFMQHRKFSELLELIEEVGPENCNLITDGGQPYNPMPALTLQTFCEMLFFKGVPQDDIELMAKENPARLLGLEEE